MTPPSAASVTSSSEAPTSSPVKLRTALPLALRAALGRARVTRAHTRAPADEAPEVRGLGQRTLAARRGDLQGVALAQVVEQPSRARTSPGSTPSGWSMKTRRQRRRAPRRGAPRRRARSRRAASRSLSAMRSSAVNRVLTQKERPAPTLGTAAGACATTRKLSGRASASAGCRVYKLGAAPAAALRPVRRRAGRGRGTAGSPCARAAASTRARAAGTRIASR